MNRWVFRRVFLTALGMLVALLLLAGMAINVGAMESPVSRHHALTQGL